MPAARPRILCLAPSWLGDAVLALPAIGQLRDAGVGVDVVTRRGTRRVFADAIGAGTIHDGAHAGRLQRFVQAWRLRARRYDAVVVLAPSWSSAFAARLSGASRRFGERGAGRDLLLSDALPAAARDVHLARSYQRITERLLEALEIEPPAQKLRTGSASAPAEAAPPVDLHAYPVLRVHDDEDDAAASLLEHQDIPRTTRPLVLAVGARYGAAKRYPVERFAAATTRVVARLGAPVVAVGGAEDAEHVGALCAQVEGCVDLSGRTDLGTLLGVLGRACAVLSNDSGVMHLAAALGVPVVGIFGSTNPRWTRPLGPRAAWIAHPVPCAPCYRRTCPIDFPCMLGLEPQVVADRLLALVGQDSGDVTLERAPL